MAASHVVVRVPATTANLGPGFDCLGMALDLSLRLDVAVASRAAFRLHGEGAAGPVDGIGDVVRGAIDAVFDEVGTSRPAALAITCHNDIPLARGLGASAAAIVGGMVAANALLGAPLSRQRQLELAARLEGHPDNVTPALLGGFRIVVQDDGELVQTAVPLPPRLRLALFVPDFAMPTAESRRRLPDPVSRADAIYNISRTALLVAALATNALSLLRVATQDRLHQPARTALFPAMPRLFEAALAAGAWGACLSGGGSSVLAFTSNVAGQRRAAAAMGAAAKDAGVVGRTLLLRPSSSGADVLEQE